MNYGKRKALAVGLGSKAEADCRVDMTSTEKSRNLSEKRRRDQFNMLINELCSMVSTNNRKMDKSSVLKSTIAYLRTQKEIVQQSRVNEIKDDWKPSFLSNDEFAQIVLESMNSFLLVLTRSGTVLYASEGVTSLLNILPNDFMNQSIYDFTHPQDRMKIYNLLSSHHMVSSTDKIPDYEKEENQLIFNCYLRVGGTAGTSQDTLYELVECCGNFRKWNPDMEWAFVWEDDNLYNDASRKKDICFYCTASVKQSWLSREISITDESKKEFASRHSLEWKFLFLDHRGPPIVGYLPFEVLGTSGYDYYHPADLEKVAQCHDQLMQTGEGTSVPYRFLTKGQQWVWLQTRYYITYNQWNSKPEFIVCTNMVVSLVGVRKVIQGENGDRASQPAMSPAPSQGSDAPSSSTWSKFGQKWAAPSSDSDTSSVVGSSERVTVTPKHPPTSKDIKGLPYKKTILTLQEHPAEATSQPALPPRPIYSQAVTLSGLGNIMSTPQPQRPPAGSSTQQVPVSQPALCPVPAQLQLHQQLQQKHQALQNAIRRQQQELQRISEQLILTSQVAIPLQETADLDGQLLVNTPAVSTDIPMMAETAPQPCASYPSQTLPHPVVTISMVTQSPQVIIGSPIMAVSQESVVPVTQLVHHTLPIQVTQASETAPQISSATLCAQLAPPK